MKILIADDELLVRYSLKSMLSDLELPIEIVGEARNGEELVRMVKSYHPDVVFVDIRMPKINGLKAIEMLKGDYPNIQWIILTGYSEFEYAKEAISLQVASYLLKPVSTEELNKSLKVIFEKNKKFLRSLNKEFENDIIALYNDLVSLSHFGPQSVIHSSNFMGGVFVVDSYMDENDRASRQLDFYNEVYSLIEEFLQYNIRLAFFVMPGGEIATIGAWGFAGEKSGQETVESYFDKLESIARRNLKPDFSLTILQSGPCSSFDMLQRQMNQLRNLAALRVVMEGQLRVKIEDLIDTYKKMPSQVFEFASIIMRLCEDFKERVYLSYMKDIDDFEKFLSSAKKFNYSQIRKPVERFLLYSLNCSMDDSGDDSKDAKHLINKLRQKGEDMLEDKAGSGNIIDRVTDYIEHNYMHDIGIARIAEQIGITPNYLSTLFHKQTGETFIKYLTKVRMLKARELLANSNAHVSQVAEEVGYHTARHFSRLYKEFYGVYPSEHRGTGL